MDGPVPPLDRILCLPSVGYTPRALEAIVRLGSITSFAEASRLLSNLMQVDVSESTVRRLSEAAGRVLVEAQDQEAARIGDELLCPQGEGVNLQQVSVDGSMVPLLHGRWAEVRLLAIGTVEQTAAGPKAVDLTYYARLTDHERFRDLARVEFFERKTELAKEVAAVTDGAEWIQDFLDEHCPDALRIIDWGHAAGYLSQAAQALFGQGTADCSVWLEKQRHALWNGNPATVVAELEQLLVTGCESVRIAHQYLSKRLEQIQYASFRAAGYPVGSGIAESGHKGVVQERLKGRGRHWAEHNVNPILGLGCASASNRWSRSWSTMLHGMRHSHRRRPRVARPPEPVAIPAPSPPAAQRTASPEPSTPPKTVNGIPTIHHPWKLKLRRRAQI